MPVIPDCQGTLRRRPGSKAGSASCGSSCAVTLGRLARSIACTQPSETYRPAIQSLTTIRSRPGSVPWVSTGPILPKNSSLSLMSSV